MLLRVLIADDESIERRVIQKIITDSKLPAVVLDMAKSGNEIIQLAELHYPDLIFMDISMPGVNGLDASCIIREKHPDTIISIITAYDEFNYAKRAIDIHVNYFLLKPIEPEEIIKIIKECIKQKFAAPVQDTTKISPKRMRLAEEIVGFIHEHYTQPVTLQYIESRLNASQQYLSRTFKEAYDMTIMNYLQQVRIERALELLKNPDLSISQVSEMIGYADPSYFGQIFRRIQGMSPLQYQYNHAQKTGTTD
ncbi:response regulator transcription factor [Paenibacillus nasutitermitis]|uniref:Two-component response regulator n=1 Tax=Paenibacillus nasutitermitis TaxID=1652958 RepID=A0A917E321_9BACL|nr:response regulator [Paenibacillus nasutitermitis]GGD96720.1 putative two-component response regulator [Paenibacillus nasutitermitis]